MQGTDVHMVNHHASPAVDHGHLSARRDTGKMPGVVEPGVPACPNGARLWHLMHSQFGRAFFFDAARCVVFVPLRALYKFLQ